jgi:predicted transcriptional regulator
MPTPRELKLSRQRAGLNQRQVATRLQISAAYIAYLEASKTITQSVRDSALSEIHSAY